MFLQPMLAFLWLLVQQQQPSAPQMQCNPKTTTRGVGPTRGEKAVGVVMVGGSHKKVVAAFFTGTLEGDE